MRHAIEVEEKIPMDTVTNFDEVWNNNVIFNSVSKCAEEFGPIKQSTM